MPLYRDSSNSFAITFFDEDGAAADVSAYDFRMEIYQNGKTITLAMADGISFETDGTDGVVNFVISKARINELCSGAVRVRLFNDAGDDPVLTHEGSETVEGEAFDA